MTRAVLLGYLASIVIGSILAWPIAYLEVSLLLMLCP